MSERIEVAGITLTLAEAREVLAFWERRCMGEVPDTVAHEDVAKDFHWVIRLGADWLGETTRLTPAIIEQIRDAVEPWREVEGGSVSQGVRGMYRGHPGRMMQGCRWATDDGRVLQMTCHQDPVLVRRPRKPALTLGEVADGTRVRREDGREGEACKHYPGDPWRYVYMGLGEAERWPLDTPVELVTEGE